MGCSASGRKAVPSSWTSWVTRRRPSICREWPLNRGELSSICTLGWVRSSICRPGAATRGHCGYWSICPRAAACGLIFAIDSPAGPIDPTSGFRGRQIKFACQPTFAAKEYELRVDMAPLGARSGDALKIQFEGSDSLREPVSVVLGDPPAPPGKMMMSGKVGDVRIANLNTFYAGLSDPQRSERIRRMLASVDADIFCFQEELNEDSFRTAAPRVVPRKGGSALNVHWQGDCGIATCLPLQPLAMQFEMRFSRTDPEDRETGVAAAIQLPDGQYMVVCSVHLSCCGFRNDVRDQSRVREARQVASQIERLRAGEFGEHLRSAGVLVVGDYNLVGSRQPLAALESAGLTEYLLCGLADQATCTWRGDEDESYWPGRLDLLTYDATALEPKSGFVLNTEDLAESLLSELGLRRDDSTASDHLLLVADFALRKKK